MNMKRGCLFLLAVFTLVLFANVMKANAVNTGFAISFLPTEEKNMFVSNINILPIDKEPTKKTIACFDVNGNRLIAIGQNTSSRRKTICVYSDKGVFQYGYTFNCSGDFGIEWDEENLNIYFVRSSAIVSVTPSGEVVDAFEDQNTIGNNLYVNNFIHSTKKALGDTEYFIGNDLGILNLFALSYSRVIEKDRDGTESVIYDAGSMQLSNILVTIVIFCAFVSIAAVVIARNLIKINR